MIFIAETLRGGVRNRSSCSVPEVPFPFQPGARFLLNGIPDGDVAAMPLLEDWGIASRLASQQGYPGCHQGYVTDLSRHWLDGLMTTSAHRSACTPAGRMPMLESVVQMARDYELPVQVSLEEFMACACRRLCRVRGRGQDHRRPAMKRVCVDGPVFDGYTVF